jgi:4-amino-4-deoxy-L-arabinose transferase-like glycosyltransferase
VPTPQRLATLLQARPRLTLVLLCLALWLPGLTTLPPTDRDESRFTQATKQMLDTGDFVRILNGAIPRNRKPIGIHWLQAPFAAAARATGLATQNPVWPYRLPSLLGAIAAVLATYNAGLTLFANRRTALAAAALLAACVILTIEAHIAKTDAALLGATTIAIAILARAFMRLPPSRAACALFWAAAGTGILIKGPITPMVLGLTALTAAIAVRDARWLARLRPLWGIPLMLAIVAPWFVAISIATHGAFFADAVGGDLGRKLAGAEQSHGAWPGTHALLLPLLTFPATVPVLCGLATAWRRRGDRATIFLLAWLLPSWAVFEAVPTKLPHYTMPLYPALMLLGAAWLTEGARPALAPWLRRATSILAAAAASLIAAGAICLPFLLHAPAILAAPALLCALPAAWFAARARTPAPAAAAIAASGLMCAALLGLELPALSPLWIAPRAEATLRQAWPAWNPQGQGLLVAGYAEPSLMFLAGTDLTLLPAGPVAADLLADHPDDAALVAGPAVPGFLAEAARRQTPVQAVGQIAGFNYSRGKATDLTLFLRKARGSAPGPR